MRSQTEVANINSFLSTMSPLITRLVKTLLQSAGLEVKEEGCGPSLVFSIKAGEKGARFYLQNLFLEIATVDRDDDPLRFDERPRDFNFFLAKMTRLAQNKLKILFHLLLEEDVDAAIENIGRDAKQFERVRIWRFDHKPT